MAGRKGDEFREHVRSPGARNAPGRRLRSAGERDIPTTGQQVVAARRRSHA